MPRETQDALLHEREIRGFLRQSHISKKNISRLQALALSKNSRIAELAILVSDIAQVTPYRRPRIRTLARERRDLLKRMEETGLILPRAAPEEIDSYDVDPVAAWYEWVEVADVENDDRAPQARWGETHMIPPHLARAARMVRPPCDFDED